MSWKERVMRSLPLVATLAGTTTFVVTNEQWALIISLVGVWLMDSPIPGTVAVARALKRRPDVSRETLPFEASSMIAMEACSENITVPCVVMHGSAEPHVLGCEGWTSDPD